MLSRPLATQSYRLVTRSVPLRTLSSFTEALRVSLCGTAIHGHQSRIRGMKKAAKAGKPKPKVPDYCDVEPQRDANGQAVWPADAAAIERAQEWLRDWYMNIVLSLSMTYKL